MNLIPVFSFLLFSHCQDPAQEPTPPVVVNADTTFVFGADLSYVNQILDHGGSFTENSEVTDPYELFANHGTDVVRLRLWHHPLWTKELYDDGTQMYNDLEDVKLAIARSKAQGMRVLLDFHYSDSWTDPGTQEVPEAWREIKDLEVLKDSVYTYTRNTLTTLKDEGLLPEFVQIGNEINCGMFISDTPEGFPDCNVCNDQWVAMGSVLNSGLRAAREVGQEDIKLILHVADPVNVIWWFENMMSTGGVSDFDVIGFSYYPLWHGIGVGELSGAVKGFIDEFDKEVMILETAYPWTSDGADSYSNIFGGQAVPGYPVSPEGQLALLRTMTQKLIDGGGTGIFYWEPAWITSQMKDKWGQGSAWENCAFFDFQGEVNQSMSYMNFTYDFQTEE